MASMMMTQQDIRRTLAPLRRRLTAQTMLVWMLRGGIAGALLAVAIELIAHVIPWQGAHLIAPGVAVAGVVAGLACGLARRPSLPATIRLADQRLALHDRLLTAWEYAGAGDVLATLQRHETETTLRGVNPRQAAPWSAPRRETPAMLGAGVALAAVLFWLPNPMDAQLRQQAAEQAHVRAAAAAVQHIAPAVQRPNNPEGHTRSSAADAQRRAVIARLLSALQTQLQTSKSTAAALKAVSQTQQKLDALTPPGGADAASALKSVESSLSNAGQSGKSTAAASTLQSLSKSAATMSAAQQAALAKELARAANATSKTPQLAGSLQQAARALGRNDGQGASAALAAAAQAAQAAQAAAQAASEVAATNSALDTLKNQIASVPNNGGEQTGQASSQTAAGQMASTNQSQGNSSGQQQGQPGNRAR